MISLSNKIPVLLVERKNANIRPILEAIPRAELNEGWEKLYIEDGWYCKDQQVTGNMLYKLYLCCQFKDIYYIVRAGSWKDADKWLYSEESNQFDIAPL